MLSGNCLIIIVVEFLMVNCINFEGNSCLDDVDLVVFVLLQECCIFNLIVVECDVEVIVQVYVEKGLINVSVILKIICWFDNCVDLVFEIIEIGVIEIEQIVFIGNSVFSDCCLWNVLEIKQVGFLCVLVGCDMFLQEWIDLDCCVLIDFYLFCGYVDFEV